MTEARTGGRGTRLRRLVAVIALGAVFVIGAAALPLDPSPAAVVAAARPLPACRYGDTLTAWRARSQFQVTILDTLFKLPASYLPPLRSVTAAGFPGGSSVRREVVPDLRAMRAAIRARGLPIGIRSAYRSYATQAATFAGWVRAGGMRAALRTSARAGHSEHQLGTAIDFTIPGRPAPWAYADWGLTPTGRWLARNAWRYGFVLSYPRGQFARSCYNYEPWHFRWVGRAIAAKIHASGLVPRAWLWRNGAALANPGPTPPPTPSPTVTPVPTPPASASPTPVPSEIPTPSPGASPSPSPASASSATAPSASAPPAPPAPAAAQPGSPSPSLPGAAPSPAGRTPAAETPAPPTPAAPTAPRPTTAPPSPAAPTPAPPAASAPPAADAGSSAAPAP